MHLDKTFLIDIKISFDYYYYCSYCVEYRCANLKRDSVFVIIIPWHKQPADWKIRVHLFKSCPMLGLDKLAFH